MIDDVKIIKRYEYGRFFRIFWFLGFWFILFMVGLVWAIWPDHSNLWFWVVEGFILAYGLYALWSFVATFHSITLTNEGIVVRQFGQEVRLPFDAIQGAKQTQFALAIKTNRCSFYLERHIQDVADLLGELKYHAPALKVDRQELMKQPLPQTINGRFRAFLFSLGISLLCGVVGGGIIWSAFDESGFQAVLMIFFGLWPLLVSGLFLYLSFNFTWRLTLLPEKIVLRYPFHKQEIPLDVLASLRMLTITSSRSPEPTKVLVLTLANGRSQRISQQEMPVPVQQLLDLIVYHYRLSLTYEKELTKIHHTMFGAGSRRPFDHYLNGESRVAIETVDDICNWLMQCEYKRDSDLFGQRDVWQLPGEFETLRQGDCEDHALWAWRKLKELNIPAEFIVGRAELGASGGNGARFSAHAWVAYQENGRTFIMETTHKKKIIYPLETVQTRYHPWYGVDVNSKTYQYSPIALGVNGGVEQ